MRERERETCIFYLYFAFLCQHFVVVVLCCLVVVLSLFLLLVSPLVAVVVNYVSITFRIIYLVSY